MGSQRANGSNMKQLHCIHVIFLETMFYYLAKSTINDKNKMERVGWTCVFREIADEQRIRIGYVVKQFENPLD